MLVAAGGHVERDSSAELGDAAEYPALAAVNHLSDPDDILAGSTIIIPDRPSPAPHTAADREVLVAAGDTLSGIAQRELGERRFPGCGCGEPLVGPERHPVRFHDPHPRTSHQPTGINHRRRCCRDTIAGSNLIKRP